MAADVVTLLYRRVAVYFDVNLYKVRGAALPDATFFDGFNPFYAESQASHLLLKVFWLGCVKQVLYRHSQESKTAVRNNQAGD